MANVFISHSSRDVEQAKSMFEWLQSQGFAQTFLDIDKHAGIPPGSKWEPTLYSKIYEAEAVVLILTRNWSESKWCFAEFTQARALGKTIFPVIEAPVGETAVADDIQNVDLVKDREGGLERLAAELNKIVDPRGSFDWDPSRPPFPGLMAFDEPDAAIYFGRDDYIKRLVERLNARRVNGGKKLIVVLGASGSGKSSLLRAGLLPRLRREKRNWLVPPPFRPQFDPVGELAQAMAGGIGPNGNWRAWCEAFAAEDPTGKLLELARDLRAAHAATEAQILISIDQAEELFGVAQENKGQHFLRILDSLLSEQLPFIAVMTLRSDYLGRLQQSGIHAKVEEFSMKPMPLERVSDIIRGPAQRARLAVDDALIMAAMRDAATEDALPLLAYALRELYDRFGQSDRPVQNDPLAQNRRLTAENYRALGDEAAQLSPLENAVRKKADEAIRLANPTSEDLNALEDAFVLAMVRVDVDGRYVRRPASIPVLPPRARPLIERLAGPDARLLVVRGEGESAVVEVAHEALLRKWPFLSRLLDEEREFLIDKSQLEQDSGEWEKAPPEQKTEALLAGLKLARAETWLLAKPQRLSEAERRFIQASIAFRNAEAAQRKRSRRIRALAIAGVAFLPIIAAAAVWQNLVAKMARAGNLASISQVQTAAGNGTGGIRFALEGLHEEPSTLSHQSLVTDAGQALFAAVQANREKIDFFASACTAEFSPDASRVLSTGYAMPRVWDTSGQSGAVLRGHGGSVYSASFSRDGSRIVTASDDATARVWSAATGDPLAVLRGHEQAVYYAAFDPHGGRIVTASKDGTARLWDISNIQNLKVAMAASSLGPIAVLQGHTMLVRWAEFSPDGTLVVTASDDGTARLWDVSKAQRLRARGAAMLVSAKVVLRVLKGVGSVFSARFNGDGTRVVTAANDSTVQVWDSASGRSLMVLRGHRGIVRSAAFSADGSRIVTASDDGTAGVWEANSGFSLAVLRGHSGPVLSAAFSRDGRRIVTASEDHTARVWDAESGDSLVVLGGHSGSVYSAEFSSDGLSVLTASEDGTTRLWSATPGPGFIGLHGHKKKINWADFSSTSPRVVTASDDGSARVWNAMTGASQLLPGPIALVWAAFLRNDNIITVSRDGTATLWRAATGIIKVSPPLPKIAPSGSGDEVIAAPSVHSVRLSRDGSHFVVVYDDDWTAQLWDAGLLHGLILPAAGILSAAFSPDGSRIATALYNGTARVWDADLHHSVVLAHGKAPVNSAEFSRDGSRIVTGSDDGIARVWDAATAGSLATLKADSNPIELAAFGSDRSRVVTSSWNDKLRVWDTVRVWNVDSGSTLWSFKGELLRLSPEGSRMLIRSGEGTAQVVNIASGELLAVIKGEIDFGTFSSDGSKFVTVSDSDKEHAALVWRLFPNRQSLINLAHQNMPKQNSLAFAGASPGDEPFPVASLNSSCPKIGTYTIVGEGL
jgi:WD40 repeat protein